MTSGALVLRKLVHRGRLEGFHCVLVGSREFLMRRWTTLEKVPGVDVVRRWLYLAAKTLEVGPARHCLVSSCSSGRWRFTGGCEAPELGYLWRC
jgi:hypothetical protein